MKIAPSTIPYRYPGWRLPIRETTTNNAAIASAQGSGRSRPSSPVLRRWASIGSSLKLASTTMSPTRKPRNSASDRRSNPNDGSTNELTSAVSAMNSRTPMRACRASHPLIRPSRPFLNQPANTS